MTSTCGTRFSGCYDQDAFFNSISYADGCCDWLTRHERDVDALSTILDVAAIEGTIKKFTSLACALRTTRNRKVGANKLPPELLSYIFALVVGSGRPFQASQDIESNVDLSAYSRTFVRVCRYWRNVAINTPTLWSFVSLSSKPGEDSFSRISLERSVVSPLTVFIDSRKKPIHQSPVFGEVMSDMLRICDLRIIHQGKLHTLPIQYAPAPHLKTLAVQVFPAIRDNNTDMGCSQLNDWFAPNIENLMVQGFDAWLGSTWRNLRCLCIGDQSYWLSRPVMQFLDVLAIAAPTLEELVLFQINVGGVSGQVQGHHPDIHMPRLKRLVVESLDMPNNTILHLLGPRLILPDTCAQHYNTDKPMEYSEMVQRSSCYTPERLFISGRSRVGVRGSSAFYAHNHVFHTETLAMVPVHEVTELWLSERFQWTTEKPNLWRTLFARMHAVRKLVVMSGELLFEEKRAFTPDTFPNLEELHLYQYSGAAASIQVYNYLSRRNKSGLRMPKVIVYVGPSDHLGRNVIETFWSEWANGPAKSLPVEVMIRTDSTVQSAPQMEIPHVCETRSELHDFWWPSWWRGRSS